MAADDRGYNNYKGQMFFLCPGSDSALHLSTPMVRLHRKEDTTTNTALLA
jgi:hypothetical protein